MRTLLERRRLRSLPGAWRVLSPGRRRRLIVLAGLVAIGGALRFAFVVAYRPAFLGYPDSAFYIDSARNSLFDDQWHVAGYAAFLRAIHAVVAALPFTMIAQHLLGVCAALLLYLAVRRIGGPAWLPFVPAAVVLLGGDELFFEHAILSETIAALALAALLFAAVRCIDDEGWRWSAVAGVLAGLATAVRVSGFVLIPLLAVWLIAGSRPEIRRGAIRGGIAAAAGAVVVAGYLIVAGTQTGHWSLTPNAPINFYGRVATFADCRKFDPPAGTSWLCDRTPLAKRKPARYYIFVGGPLIRRYGQFPKLPNRTVSELGRYARAAAIHQPLDWLRVSVRDFFSYVDPPNDVARSPTGYVQNLAAPVWTANAVRFVDGYYSDATIVQHARLLDALRDYERVTRVEGVPMALLLVLALAAPLACRGRLRRASLLFTAAAYATIAVPVVALDYDTRFAVPAYGPLAAAGGMGLYGLVTRFRERRAAPARSA